MSYLGKIIGLGTAALGFLMFRDGFRHSYMDTRTQEVHMVEEDHLHHLLHQMGDYSDRGTLNSLKHTVFNPANLHFITRPWMHVKNFFNTIVDNIIPVGLGLAGLGFAFPQATANTFSAIRQYTPSILGAGWNALRRVGGAFSTAIWQPMWGVIRNWRPNLGGPFGILAAAAFGLMGVYYAAQFKKELTQESRDNLINYLHSPGGH